MPRKKKVSIDAQSLVEKLVKNIDADRALILCSIHNIIGNPDEEPIALTTEKWKEVGQVTAKFFESLARTNEQTIKLVQSLSVDESEEMGEDEDLNAIKSARSSIEQEKK